MNGASYAAISLD
jgi:hypothetical protein